MHLKWLHLKNEAINILAINFESFKRILWQFSFSIYNFEAHSYKKLYVENCIFIKICFLGLLYFTHLLVTKKLLHIEWWNEGYNYVASWNGTFHTACKNTWISCSLSWNPLTICRPKNGLVCRPGLVPQVTIPAYVNDLHNTENPGLNLKLTRSASNLASKYKLVITVSAASVF